MPAAPWKPLAETRALARRRARVGAALAVAVLVAAAVCARLGWIVHETRWTMDADEAVHAIEALRLHDDLARGDAVGFLADIWLPERWQPPVNPNVRWYPPVHALFVQPAFALLGPSEFSARIPSVVLLFLSALVLFELGRRLAPAHPAASGLLAVLLLLAAPNVLTFSAQSLIEPAVLFTCWLAFLAYVWSLQAGHPLGRAAVAGLVLGAAVLTKYDHGGLLAASLGIAELGRARFRPLRLLRSGASLLLGVAAAVVALWFASPEKIEALRDSAMHPFFGSPREIAADFVLTWIVEYGSSLAMGAMAFAALLLGWRRWRDPAVRALWLWIALTTVFLAVRARFHFRYNLVEAPGALLLAAVLLPGWTAAWARGLARGRPLLSGALLVAGALALACGAAIAADPGATFRALERPFTWAYELREDRWGMALGPRAYVEHYAEGYRAAAAWGGGSLLALGAALAVAGAVGLVVARRPEEAVHLRRALALAAATAVVPGALLLHVKLSGMVEWELEGHPELDAVLDFVVESVPVGDEPVTVLLGGGWDQLPNNALRWALLTRPPEPPQYDRVEVVGDMIGSLVFPPEPRIRHWARVLAEAPGGELPARVVLVDARPDFLYETRLSPEARLYREILERRGGYESVARRAFDALGCEVEVLARRDPGPPVEGIEELLRAHGVGPDAPPESSRRPVGEGGWRMRDESLRHFVRR